jgi:AraC family transcriptional regulator
MKLVPLDNSPPFELTEGITRSSGDKWPGLSLREVVTSDTGELPEGYLVDHELVLTTRWASRNEMYFPDSGWAPMECVPGSVHFMPIGVPFANRWSGRMELISLTLSNFFVRSVQGDGDRRILEARPHMSTDDRLLAEILSALSTDLREGFPSGRLHGEQLATAMVAHMLHRWGVGSKDASAGRSLAPPKKFEWVVDYIHAHIQEDLSISSLAAILELGTDHFIRCFKHTMGITPHQYVLRCRIAHAKTLLSKPRASVKQVGVRCGFPDQSHFIKVFRRATGITPAEFRDQLSS